MSKNVPAIVAIDIGTNKISILIGFIHAADKIEVKAMAHVPNRGMTKGKITDINKVVQAIKNAVQQVEETTGYRIHKAWVAIPSTELRCHYAYGHILNNDPEHIITTSHIAQALDKAKSGYLTPDYYLVNVMPLGFQIDSNEDWINQPIGITGRSIIGHYQLMMLPITTLQNIENLFNKADIAIEKMILSPIANAESSLLKDEKEYGVCLVDIGAGITSITVYIEGRLAFIQTLTIGGDNVSKDIAAVLQTTTEEAEKLKLKYGCVDLSTVEANEMIKINTISQGVQTISKLELAEIIYARYNEIFNKIIKGINSQLSVGALYHGIVLTGGACQIKGMLSFAQSKLNTTVHFGHFPKQIYAEDKILAELKKTTYVTTTGLLLFSQSELQKTMAQIDGPENDDGLNFLQKIWQKISEWFSAFKNFF